jgi:hypothetical protein
MESNLEIPNSNTLKYYFLNKEGKEYEATLAWHLEDDCANAFIFESSFRELAHNLEINLEELHFKYSPLSKVCLSGPPTSERCYPLDKVFNIFSELKAGMVLMNEKNCCHSNLPLCSQAFRDSTYLLRTNGHTSVFFNFNRECLIDEQEYLYTSKQRLKTRGDIYCDGSEEYTLNTNPGKTDHWLWHFKKLNRSIEKLLRLEKSISNIYKNKDNPPEYY